MKAKHPAYFAFYPLVFSGDNRVLAMSHTALGAYVLLLCAAWQEEPPGTLPEDDAMLARYARMSSEQWIQVKSEVVAAFRNSGGRWVQKRLVEEYRKSVKLMKVRSAAGLAGVEAKRRKGSAKVEQTLANGQANTIYISSPSQSSDGLGSGEGVGGGVILPDCLRTAEFMEAWNAYQTHRQQRGDAPLTAQAVQSQMQQLGRWGLLRALAALRTTTANGWKNIREPDNGNGRGIQGGAGAAGGGGNGSYGGRGRSGQHRADKRGREFEEPPAPLPIIRPATG